MPYNAAGLAAPHDVNRFSLHSTNPGLGVNPVAGELTDAPYARQNGTLAAVTTGSDAGGLFARANLASAVSFSLATGATAQNVQFVGVWKDDVYKGYEVPNNPKNFNDPDSTTRTFILTTAFALEIRNPA